jgi:anti-anti-sigma factor
MCNFRERNSAMNDSETTTIEMETSKRSLQNNKLNQNGHVVFSVYGNFDRENTDNVFEGITPLFQEENKGVTMDIEGVTQIDNSGIATIVECIRMASDSKTEFLVVGINNNIKEVLELSKLSSIFINMEFSTFCSSSRSGTLGCHIKEKAYSSDRLQKQIN